MSTGVIPNSLIDQLKSLHFNPDELILVNFGIANYNKIEKKLDNGKWVKAEISNLPWAI